MMNSMYYFFDSINTTSIDKEILDWFNISDDQYIIFNIMNLNAFKELYNSVKNIRINGLPEDLLKTIALRTIGLSNVNHLTDSQQEAKIREQASLERRQVASPELEGIGPDPAAGERRVRPRTSSEEIEAQVGSDLLNPIRGSPIVAPSQALLRQGTSPGAGAGARRIGVSPMVARLGAVNPLGTIFEEVKGDSAAGSTQRPVAQRPQYKAAPASASSQATAYSLSAAGSGSESGAGAGFRTARQGRGGLEGALGFRQPGLGGTRRQNFRYRKTRKNRKD
jgi:hypothetical protein